VVESRYNEATQELVLAMNNPGGTQSEISVQALAYASMPVRRYQLAPAGSVESRWPIASDHWYDIEIRNGSAVWQLAGHVETGRASRSDPALG
jgi:phospholipase C